MPYIFPIIEKTGRVSHSEKNNYGGYDIEIVGRAEINGKKHVVTVILATKPDGMLYLSIFGIQNNMVKSLNSQGQNGSPPGFPALSSLSRVRKQPSPCKSRNIIIPYISAVSIENLSNIELFVKNITPQNRKDKFTKAIQAVSKQLKIPVSIGKKEHSKEPYLYRFIENHISKKRKKTI